MTPRASRWRFWGTASTEWRFAARMLQGLALGAASGPSTAALTGARTHRRPAQGGAGVHDGLGGRSRRAVSAGGLGLGPVLAGLLAEYAPARDVLPFAVEIALLVPAAGVIAAFPASRPGAGGRPRRPALPAAARTVFAAGGTSAFLAFAVTGLFLSLAPTCVATLSGSANLLLGGASVALMLLSSALAQLAGHGRPARALELLGLPLLATGLVGLALAGGLSSLALLLAATVIAGVGHGLALLGGLTAVHLAAPADRRAGVLSGFYVIVCLGVGAPVIGVGLLATVTGPLGAVQSFACAVAVLCLMALFIRTRVRA
ncbi:MFS transporter [Nonomuraea aridisoli]|uniref:MFS transporter n=1 Tax=Nonomuraea aridisoli TaxID=2070368 RepID=UPI0015E89B58|nr:MFS transporter [Nonomuraea aridisoli]